MYCFKAVAVLIALIGFAGCSEQTKQETREAAQETSEAVKSATKDAAENTKEVAEDIERALDRNDAGED